MIIVDSNWLELYAQYRERLLLGPLAPLSNQATELPCLRRTPPGLRSVRVGDPVPFLRWASEGAGDPFDLPGRLLMATRLIGVPATSDDLETSGILGLEHGENLWQSGLAVLALTAEAVITGDSQPTQLATGITRALRRIGTLCPGQGESTSPGSDGFGYMLRADAVDDTTTADQGLLRFANYCDWLGNIDNARGLEPSAGHYLGMLSGLVLARRLLLTSGTTSAAQAEIESRLRACNQFLSQKTAYWIRRSDATPVLQGSLAFGVAWPLAVLQAEVAGTQGSSELGNFQTAELANALVEFAPATVRPTLVQEIQRTVGQALWAAYYPTVLAAITPDDVSVLQSTFPDDWLGKVVFPLRSAVDQFVSDQLGASLPGQLDSWLDQDTLAASSTEDMARSWWQRCEARILDSTLMPADFDALSIPLRHILGTAEITFPASSLQITITTPDGSFQWPTINLPALPFRPGDQPFFLHLTSSALLEELAGAANASLATVRLRVVDSDAPGTILASDGIGPAPSVAFSPAADSQLASGHWDGLVRLRDIQTGTVTSQYDTNGGPVQALSFNSDGQYLAAGVRTGPILVYKMQDPGAGQILSLPGHIGGTHALVSQTIEIGHLAYAVIASGGADRMIRLWDFQSGNSLLQWNAHAGPVRALAFVKLRTSDSLALLSAGDDGAVRVWNPSKGAILQELVNTGAPIRAMCATAKTGIAATGGADGILRLWDATNGLELAVDRALPAGITVLAVSTDDQLIIAGTTAGTSHRYSLDVLQDSVCDGFDRVDTASPGSAWTVLSGTWQTDGTRLVSNVNSGELLYKASAPGSDYSVRVVTRADPASAGASNVATHGVLARVQQPSGILCGYQATLAVSDTTGTVQLWRIVAGTPGVIASANVAARIGTDHVLELIVQATRLSVVVDDISVLNYVDTDPLGLGTKTQAGLSWDGDVSGDTNPRWDNFQIRPILSAKASTIEGSDPVASVGISAPQSETTWLAVSTAQSMPSYPWRIAAVAAADGDSNFDALACAARDNDAMFLALAHLFLGVTPQANDDRFSEVMSHVAQAPPGFPHAGAPNGWDRTFCWASRAGVADGGARPNELGNGLDLLAPTAIAAAADPTPDNRQAFRKALLLGS